MAAGIGPGPEGHALAVLEVPEVLERIAGLAVGEAGAARVRALRPCADADVARRQLAAVGDLVGILSEDGAWELTGIPAVGPAISRLKVPGSLLEPEQLIAVGVVLATTRAAAERLRGRVPDGGVLSELVDLLWADRALERRLAETFDEDGAVSDRASPELRRIRRELNTGRGRLVERLEAYVRSLPDRVRVPDASITIRSGRYCIPIRREGKSTVGGLVHDASGSRQTLFVEPPVAIDAMNEIRELEIAERREIDRILRVITDALRERATELESSYVALVDLDSLRARALFSIRLGASLPRLDEPTAPLDIVQGRHPLLDEARTAVPFDLRVAEDETVLLISGPNAGGKTVLLKSIGLAAVLAKSGVIPPVGEGSRIPAFGQVFAVIGDEQSISASLSTFGAQARNLAEILERSTRDDLVLIDEIGSATDPAEGGALAAAILAALADRVRLTVATTHLGDLKGLAAERPSTVNASLQFDAERLEPTYRLERDRPGRSYALEIAGRLGIPAGVLDDARSRLDQEHRAVDDVLATLERDQQILDRERVELSARVDAVARRETSAARRAEEVERKELELARERGRALEETLLEGRTRIEETITRLETEWRGADEPARRSAKRAARGEIERSLRETRRRAETGREVAPATGEAVAAGDEVRWAESGRTGRLVELRGGRGVVEVDGLRLTVPAADLRAAGPAPEAPATASPPATLARLPELEMRTEVDLRGLRAEEVEAVLVPALDAAIVAEIPWLRIIHGKGTGALRSVVEALLGADPRVESFRAGDAREGGTGVTVVEFE